MKYTITGADSETGEDVEMTIEAASEQAARESASRKGVMVASCEAPIVRDAARPVADYSPRLQSGHIHGAPVINVATPRRGNSLGVAGMIIGIVAFLLCWVPFVNVISALLGLLGLLLAIVGLFVSFGRKGSGVGYPIAGVAFNGLALFIAIPMLFVLTGGATALRKASQQTAALDSTSAPAPAVPEIPPPPVTDQTQMPAAIPAIPKDQLIQWTDAGKAILVGKARVSVRRADVAKVALKNLGGDKATSKDALLSIVVEIGNTIDTAKLEYRTWMGNSIGRGDVARLSDNFGNVYKRVDFGFGTEVVGAVKRSESIYPAATISDVLVFEKPIDRVEFLNLELPGEAVGENGLLRFRIPASMIKRH